MTHYSFRYWDKAPEGFQHLTPGQYKAMQAAGQLPTRVLGLTPTANIAAQYPMAGGYFTRQGTRLNESCTRLMTVS